ncbi:MAG: hypothetical protein IJ801_01590, partial [Lachnospiraceae bacterium]|nr:hypothetical protein [Lachnospiraceae bacterium]
GLPNIKCLVDAVAAYKDDDNIAMFEKFGILNKAEL